MLRFSAVTLVGFITRLSGGEVFIEWEAYSSNSLRFILLLVLDYISLLFLRTVGIIAGGVFIYRGSYMRQDKHYAQEVLFLTAAHCTAMVSEKIMGTNTPG